MSMFNECHIYLCDCTWLIVFSHAQSLLIKHKKIYDFLVVFGKYFVFTKVFKISKIVLPCFGDLVVGWSSHMPQSRELIGRSMSQSRKILRIFFKIWVFNGSHSSDWRLVRGWRFQSWGYLEIFATYFATFSRVELPVAKNTYRIFQNFFLSVLATGPGDLHVTWFNRESCVFTQ